MGGDDAAASAASAAAGASKKEAAAPWAKKALRVDAVAVLVFVVVEPSGTNAAAVAAHRYKASSSDCSVVMVAAFQLEDGTAFPVS